MSVPSLWKKAMRNSSMGECELRSTMVATEASSYLQGLWFLGREEDEWDSIEVVEEEEEEVGSKEEEEVESKEEKEVESKEECPTCPLAGRTGSSRRSRRPE